MLHYSGENIRICRDWTEMCIIQKIKKKDIQDSDSVSYYQQNTNFEYYATHKNQNV